MNRALIVGVDNYPDSPLYGCVNDAEHMTEVLSRNADGSPNFHCKTIVAPRKKKSVTVTRRSLRDEMRELFAEGADVALFYFAGHGDVSDLGGYLLTQDYQEEEGVDMWDLLRFANKSKVDEVFIILDCCHSGSFGRDAYGGSMVQLREGISVLTAARPTQLADELDGRGLFTTLVCEALSGGASDVRGRVTAAGVYAFVDQALGAWQQRPMFQAHVARQLPLRICKPAVEDSVLRELSTHFPKPDHEFALDPSYDPDLKPKNKEHESAYTRLQQYRDARLLVPVGEEYLYYAAKNSKPCRLTDLGRFYWKLANEGKI